MRIAHSQLERVRANLREYILSMGKQRFGGPGRFQYVQWAVVRYHKRGLDSARSYLEEAFARRQFQKKGLDRFREYLELYHHTFSELDSTPISILANLTLTLTSSVAIGGRIGRIDLTDTGYAVWVFTEGTPNIRWKNELRYPLLQGAYADQLGANPKEVQVGLYSFADAQYHSTCYALEDINEAFAEAKYLAEKLESYL